MKKTNKTKKTKKAKTRIVKIVNVHCPKCSKLVGVKKMTYTHLCTCGNMFRVITTKAGNVMVGIL